MTPLREAAQQALEALEYGQHTLKQISENQWESRGQLAITALKAALAEPVQGCPSCEYNKARAQLWRHEAYKAGGHPLDWEPELMVRPKPLTNEEIRGHTCECVDDGTFNMACAIDFARAIERAHGIGEKE